MCGIGGREGVDGAWAGGSSDAGEAAREEEAEAAGEEGGEAREAVETRDAAIVRRMWDSVERVAVVIHAVLC